MENKRAGFSFKAIGVVGFVLLTFILFRVLRLPDGAIASDMLPNFLMLLLGILVLASSFILLALGRIVELLQGFSSSKALLNEIRDETERIRIESQYIYEVQKDTLVKLTSVDETPVVDPYIAHQAQLADQTPKQESETESQDNSDVNDLLSTDKSSGLGNMQKTEMTSKGASFAASRLSKNIGQANADQAKIDQLKLNAQQSDLSSTGQSESLVSDSDIKANTDESTWSTLSSFEDTGKNTNTYASNESSSNNDSSDRNPDEKAALHFDKVGELPVTDSEYDAASLDGSDDVVDDLPQSKIWKPVSEDELVSKDIEAKVTEVEDADISESLEKAVVGLEPTKPQTYEPRKSENTQKPVFEDRLSQTERPVFDSELDSEIDKPSDKMNADSAVNNAVRFGSFPETVSDLRSKDEFKDEFKGNAKSSFTLEDITDDFNNEDFSVTSNKGSTNGSNLDSKEEAFAQEDKVESLADVFSNKSKDLSEEKSSFTTKGFGTVEDSFENAEDSFDDIREVFDTKAKKLTSEVNNISGISGTQNGIKDSLKRVSDKVSDEASEIGKNLN